MTIVIICNYSIVPPCADLKNRRTAGVFIVTISIQSGCWYLFFFPWPYCNQLLLWTMICCNPFFLHGRFITMTMHIRRSAFRWWFSRFQVANQFSLTKQWQVLVKQTGGAELHFSTSVRTSGSVHGVLWSTSRPMHLHKHRAREAWHYMASIGPSWPSSSPMISGRSHFIAFLRTWYSTPRKAPTHLRRWAERSPI